MFTKDITGSDAFREMPSSSQCLYFHLGMEADDDGFLDGYKSIQRAIGSSDDDFKILVAKRFVLEFPNGICVIKHWLMNNTIRKDRYKPTKYTEEKKALNIKENGAYTFGLPNGNQMATIGKPFGNPVEDSIEEKRRESIPTLNFFNNKEQQLEIYNWLVSKGYAVDVVKLELAKFISYWSETNIKTGRQRWQGEKYFEIKKRFGSWFSRIKQ